MHCMLMDLLHGFEVLSTTEETLFNSRNVSRLVQNNLILFDFFVVWWVPKAKKQTFFNLFAINLNNKEQI